MGCGIMGCFRDRNNNGLITSEEPKIETISEFRLTEGMLVQQAEGYPEDNRIYIHLPPQRKLHEICCN